MGTNGFLLKRGTRGMDNQSCSHGSISVPDRPLHGEEAVLAKDILLSIIRPNAVVEKIVVGSKFLGVVAGARMGLSSLLGARPREEDNLLVQQLVGKPVKEAASLIKETSPFAVSLGYAAVNAGSTPDPAKVEPSDLPAKDLIVSLGKDRLTGLVGEFPFVEDLKPRVGTLHLFELQKVPGAVPRDQWEEVLATLDVLAVTGTALLTRNMAWFLSRAKQAKIVILGPTTPLSTTLFDHGADYLCGSVVTDMEKVGQGLLDGLPFKKVKQNGGIIFTQWEK
ncbi:MAG: DUF364 domain-containing protein [Desulfobacteraceae bacterium]